MHTLLSITVNGRNAIIGAARSSHTHATQAEHAAIRFLPSILQQLAFVETREIYVDKIIKINACFKIEFASDNEHLLDQRNSK